MDVKHFILTSLSVVGIVTVAVGGFKVIALVNRNLTGWQKQAGDYALVALAGNVLCNVCIKFLP